MRDALVIVALLLGSVGLFWFAGLRYWAYFWLSLTLILALWEGVAKLRKGRTLSQRFQAYRRDHPLMAGVLLGMMVLGTIGLAVHLWR